MNLIGRLERIENALGMSRREEPLALIRQRLAKTSFMEMGREQLEVLARDIGHCDRITPQWRNARIAELLLKATPPS
jgi:hypothetical protein